MIVVKTPGIPVTGGIFKERKERFLANTWHGSLNAARAFVDAVPVPDTLPAYSSLLADREGNVWVEEFQWRPDQPHVWTVFTADGEPLGRTAVPVGVRVLQAGRNYVVGVHKDDLDVGQVRAYAVNRSGRR